MMTGAFFFALMSALVKVAGRRVPVMEIILARSLVVAILAAAWLLRAGAPLLGRERGLLALRGVLGLAALTCFYSAVIHLPLADATVIQYMNPIFTALIAAVVLHEAMSWREPALALVSLLGVVLVARPTAVFSTTDALDPVWVGVGLLGAVLSASAYVAVRRLRREDPLVIVLYLAVVSGVVALPLALRGFVMPDAATWGLLLGVGASTFTGQVFLTRALGIERAGAAVSVAYVQIIFAAGWGWLLFGDAPDAFTGAGALIIIGSTALLVRLHPVVGRR